MQTATLVLSGLSFIASATTLVIVVVALKRGNTMVAEVAAQADNKVQAFKQAIADL